MQATSSPTFAKNTPESGRQQASFAELVQQARQDGHVNVIVTLSLDTAFRQEGDLSYAATQQQRNFIAQTASRVLSDLAGADTRVNREYETIPALALRVDEAGLSRLSRSSHVLHISEDALSAPTLEQSVPWIGADDAWSSGYDGEGWAVAILDTGIDTDHEFFKDESGDSRIVAEVCFSNGTGSQVSLCPNGNSSQFGSRAADADIPACRSGVNQLCNHGTHVAGIAAGYSATRKGVAPKAGIIGMQVFTRFNSSSDCSPYSPPCVMSYNSDQMAALDYINSTLRHQHQIASANMSLGGGAYSDYCDSSSTKPAIDNLRSNGIATVIATGNGGRKNQIGSPACISTSVAVSSTTKEDTVSSFSDVASIMDLFAPGTSISSSVVGDYASYNGTSMATPHVAGAWAVMKQARPAATVGEVLSALINTGVPITDQRSNGSVTKPRIQLDDAVSVLPDAVFHMVTPSIGTGLGQIFPPIPQTVFEGTSITFTLTPGLSHVIDSVDSDCGGEWSGNMFQIESVTSNCNVIVNFAGNGGDLVCSGLRNHSIPRNTNGASVNWITGDIQNSFVPSYHFNPYNDQGLRFWWYFGAESRAGVASSVGASDYLVLQAGNVVGPASVWSTVSESSPPVWLTGADGYLGFRFNCSTISNAPDTGICYGYAHLTTTAPAGFPATLVDFCWNKAGNAVVVPSAGPGIGIASTSLNANQAINTTTSQILSIISTGTESLTWSIENEPASRPIALGLEGITGSGTCTDLADVPWLSVSPMSGTIAPGASASVSVGFNTAGLSPGTYNANLCIASDDPAHPLLEVPVELTVNWNIFVNGFEN